MSGSGGYLGVYYGCMFAGKTSRLIKELSKFHDLKLRVVYITHSTDTRATACVKENITTHWSVFSQAQIPFDCYKTSSLTSLFIEGTLFNYDVIGIDEFQFFGQEACEIVKGLVDHHDSIVFCAGLDSNFRREKFGHILDLIPHASEARKIHAICDKCKAERPILPSLIQANFTAKIAGDLSVEKEAGGGDKYIPLCRKHYLAYAHEHGLDD